MNTMTDVKMCQKLPKHLQITNEGVVAGSKKYNADLL